ncbi:MAG: hypothetical protein LBH95_01870 [Oscillospiraceae bacterium]|jgi:phosphatidylethanolamine-binding protein (PEBP) family uncharacterized protein|nr:hypothetical protein [Oscillospiraceae bacterium]
MKSNTAIKLMLVLFIITGVSGCTRPKFEDAALNVPQIAVSSDSVDETGKLLTETAADRKPNNPLGSNQSPHLAWDAVDGAAYYAVCMFDESANWLHWLVLDTEKTELAQGEYTSRNEYVGPYPPQNSGQHHYRIEVFALKQATDHLILKLDAKHSYSDIARYLNRSGNGENNIVARGYVMGIYEN